MPPSTPPAHLPYYPSPRIPLGAPLYCTVSHKGAHFKRLLGMVCTHMGPKWLRFRSRDIPPNTPPACLPYHPSTHIPRGPPCGAMRGPKVPISRLFWVGFKNSLKPLG